MKNLISIIVILFAFVGCRESENGAYKYRKSAKMEDSVVGTYKRSKPDDEGYYYHIKLRKDGVCEKYWLTDDGKEFEEERLIANWKVKNDELIVTNQKRDWINSNWVNATYVHRIEKDGSLTSVASGLTRDGKFERRDKALKDFRTWKKLKE